MSNTLFRLKSWCLVSLGSTEKSPYNKSCKPYSSIEADKKSEEKWTRRQKHWFYSLEKKGIIFNFWSCIQTSFAHICLEWHSLKHLCDSFQELFDVPKACFNHSMLKSDSFYVSVSSLSLLDFHLQCLTSLNLSLELSGLSASLHQSHKTQQISQHFHFKLSCLAKE